MAKTWKQKLEEPKEPKVKVLQKPMAGALAGGTLLMPTPQLVKAFIEAIPAGQQIAFKDMRESIAKTQNSDVACPLSTSTCARIVAEAAWEDIQLGADPSQVTPFWRAIAPDSTLAKKLACGSAFIEHMREQERA
ncbi:hypothetical protein VB780_12610 [Leptolyngbya sp. CCNP1308]|uniref:hypothetical protein n=1 Tax=Leptolyngbya sp. CCNP1308 TaxID=3110255 RepID=UPI002B21CB03|nr:hypothetical protein [Leptolyngbya sp. CCNP1308]MEA5449417.1 hypothetical protein [Leptolyngbya sp. CCNP1308]